MNNEKLGELLGKMANFYLSIPVTVVKQMLSESHPEITPEELDAVLQRCTDYPVWQRCGVETVLTPEPELAALRLVQNQAFYKQFLAARRPEPYAPMPPEYHYQNGRSYFDLPEIQSFRDFGRSALELDDDGIEELIFECSYGVRNAVWQRESWLVLLIRMNMLSGIFITDFEQLKSLQEMGRKLYQNMPNPVLSGHRPREVENPPVLPDDLSGIKEQSLGAIKDIAHMTKLLGINNGSNKQEALSKEPFRKDGKKIGRNDPCPCGSGKKYKKCCGR